MEHEKISENLTILDGKCSALLQLSAVILAIATIPVTSNRIEGPQRFLAIFIAGDFLLTSLLLLSVLWYSEMPDEKLLQFRIKAYKLSLLFIGVGLIAMGGVFFLSVVG